MALALLGDRSAAGDRAVEEVAGQNSPRVPDGAVAHDYFDSGSRARIEIRENADRTAFLGSPQAHDANLHQEVRSRRDLSDMFQ